MAIISDIDRTMILNTINQNSNRFTDYESRLIHKIALLLHEMHIALIAREDNSRL